MLDLKSEIDSL